VTRIVQAVALTGTRGCAVEVFQGTWPIGDGT
jgi:hypothetical protein